MYVYYKEPRMNNTYSCYVQVIEFLEHEISLKGDEEVERKSLVQVKENLIFLLPVKML